MNLQWWTGLARKALSNLSKQVAVERRREMGFAQRGEAEIVDDEAEEKVEED